MNVIWRDESNESNLAMICYSNATVIYLVRFVLKSSSKFFTISFVIRLYLVLLNGKILRSKILDLPIQTEPRSSTLGCIVFEV